MSALLPAKRVQWIRLCWPGDSVLVMDPASNGVVVSNVDITLKLRDGKVIDKKIDGILSDTQDYGVSEEFMQRFAPENEAVQNFVSKKIGSFTETISTRPAYFGSSAFIDLIHELQLAISGADISFAAPLSYDTEIRKGDIFVNDMFNLYKYENMLYTMRLTGKEIRDALEMSYDLWTNRMKSPRISYLTSIFPSIPLTIQEQRKECGT